MLMSAGPQAGRGTPGERRLAERLQKKLHKDWLLWWDVPVGPQQTRPDFLLMHPQRGALVLEVKDWHLQTIRSATRERFEIAPEGQPLKVVKSPLQQAWHCVIQVVNALERDAQLVQPDGPHQGKLVLPWGHGVVLTQITRQQFDAAGLGAAMAPHLVVCKDEMLESVDAAAFAQRLHAMFPYRFGAPGLTPQQLDRVRWILFPEVRVPQQQSLFGASGEDEDARLPDLMQVMDLQQEQLARSLGDGHRVIHGVAGSGKTMILGYRAEHLAKTQTAASKPILVLCYNEPLAVKLAADMAAKGLHERVHVRHFHKWCRDQLVQHQLLPEGTQRKAVAKLMDEYVRGVIAGVEAGHIPTGQYHAVLIDEGHDFAPEWLTLATQMVDLATNSLLLLYDDAQSIYDRTRTKSFSLKSVGIQASGRTTILKINYRNTRQILQLAHRMAGDLLQPEDAEGGDDGIPLLQPLSCGREGPEPIVIDDLPTLPERAARVAELLADQYAQGHPWGDMAVLCRHHSEMEACAVALARKGLPHRVRKRSGDYRPEEDAIKVMTMHASKGLEWPVVAVMGSCGSHETKVAEIRDAILEARVFYVAATRATQSLVIFEV